MSVEEQEKILKMLRELVSACRCVAPKSSSLGKAYWEAKRYLQELDKSKPK